MMIVTKLIAYPAVKPSVAWRRLYQGPAITQPSDQARLAAAAYVARSRGRSRSMANALKIGFPAFISELRIAIAPITVHRIGLNPSTARNGMLTAWTSTTEPILPTRRASAGWKRIASVVPRLVSAKIALSERRSLSLIHI